MASRSASIGGKLTAWTGDRFVPMIQKCNFLVEMVRSVESVRIVRSVKSVKSVGIVKIVENVKIVGRGYILRRLLGLTPGVSLSLNVILVWPTSIVSPSLIHFFVIFLSLTLVPLVEARS